jgi:DNA-binding winged helix-turn-helix (wHTH) protein/Tol biopolymer transport system component
MQATKSFVFRFDNFEVREREFCLVKSGELIPVEPKAFRVLLILLRNPQKLITKDELLHAVWGDTAVTENSLARSIALLRRLLGDETRKPRYIETVATVGYRFLCKVESSARSGEDQEDTSSPDALSGTTLTEEAAHVEIAGSASHSEFDKAARTGRSLTGISLWAVAGAALVVCAAAGFLYLFRPMPQPHITTYSQITYDGARKTLLGTDGNRLFFDNGSSDSIAQVAATGGAVSMISIPGPRFAFPEDVSPDGANFLIATSEKESGLDLAQWNVRVPEGSLHRLPNGVNAAFSPDGNSVAYQTGDGGLWVARSDGSGEQKLASGQSLSSSDVQPSERSDRFSFPRIAWSPDGNTLRFENHGRLWEISASGSHLHELIPGWHLASTQCCGSWTPDGKLFVFVDRPGGPITQTEIWALSERGGMLARPLAQPVQLTTGPIAWGQPIAGKDGKKIFATGKTRHGELVRLDLKTKQFQPFLNGISAHFVSFSNDGQFVAYVSYPAGILWSANRDGSNPVQLTEPPIHPLMPRWSPDGTQLLFCDMSAPPWAAYVVAARGGSPQRLPGSPEPRADANWSADGKEIVFSTTGPFNRNGNLHILNLAMHQVTTVAGSEGLYSPRWSPDGRFIAAMPIDSNRLEVFDRDTRQWSVLAHDGIFAFPSWSTDGQFLYFAHSVKGDFGVFRISVRGGHLEHITGLSGIHLGGGWSWIGLDPTNSPMVMRDVGSEDIYALDLEQK